MKKIVVAVVASLSLVFAGAAYASVDSNLAASVKRNQENFPKWVVIAGTHTASSGTFGGTWCASQVVFADGTVVWLSGYYEFTFSNTAYSNNGNYVARLANSTDTGIGC